LGTPPVSKTQAQESADVYNQCIKAGYAANARDRKGSSALYETAKRLKLTPGACRNRLERAANLYHIKLAGSPAFVTEQDPNHFEPQAAHLAGPTITLTSRPDNTFLIGACGDQHIGSKYFRQDVLDDVYARYSKAKVQAVFNTGNWIDGVAPFNRHDLVAHGLEEQVQLLARVYPRAKFPTYAITGDDHEGWWAQREGIDVGNYTQNRMQEAGHLWHDLGYMEAHIRLKNANNPKATATLAVVHPGGGSAYAYSYSIQKIVESLEGGEKPNVAFYGHYHKMWSGNVRNVWVFQTGCTQDQTPFMRKKRLEAHVGAYMVGLEQDPKTGAIIGCTATCWRYFNRAYYDNHTRWSHHGPVNMLDRSMGGT
jgi:hypothetical protein